MAKKKSQPPEQWALFDVSNLVWRSFHTPVGELESDGSGVGSIFGALLSALSVIRDLSITHAVWCFDAGGDSRREQILPTYKSTRKSLAKAEAIADPEQAARRAAVYPQLRRLQTTMCDAGFCVATQKGYEADDLMAACVAELEDRDTPPEVFIVSTDKDLYQCLSDTTSVMRLGGKQPIYTKQSLFEEFGVSPEQWVMVKAIAGDDGDDIPGVPGAGPKTAAKYVSGTLPTHHKIYDTIAKATDEWVDRRVLVELPFEGTAIPDLRVGGDVLVKLQRLYKVWGFEWRQ